MARTGDAVGKTTVETEFTRPKGQVYIDRAFQDIISNLNKLHETINLVPLTKKLQNAVYNPEIQGTIDELTKKIENIKVKLKLPGVNQSLKSQLRLPPGTEFVVPVRVKLQFSSATLKREIKDTISQANLSDIFQKQFNKVNFSTLKNKLEKVADSNKIAKSIEKSFTSIDINAIKRQFDDLFAAITTDRPTMKKVSKDMADSFGSSLKILTEISNKIKGIRFSTTSINNMLEFVNKFSEALPRLNEFAQSGAEAVKSLADNMTKMSQPILNMKKNLNELSGTDKTLEAISGGFSLFKEIVKTMAVTFADLTNALSRVTMDFDNIKKTSALLPIVFDDVSKSMLLLANNFKEGFGANRLDELIKYLNSMSGALSAFSTFMTTISSSLESALKAIGKDGEQLKNFLNNTAEALKSFSKIVNDDTLAKAPALTHLGDFISSFKLALAEFGQVGLIVEALMKKIATVFNDVTAKPEQMEAYGNAIKNLGAAMKDISKIKIESKGFFGIDQNNMTRVKALIIQIADGFGEMSNKLVEAFKGNTVNAISNMSGLLSKLSSLISSIGQNFEKAFKAMDIKEGQIGSVSKLKLMFLDLSGAIKAFALDTNNVSERVTKLLNSIAGLMNSLKSTFSNVVTNVEHVKIALSGLSEVLPTLSGDDKLIKSLADYTSSFAQATETMTKFQNAAALTKDNTDTYMNSLKNSLSSISSMMAGDFKNVSADKLKAMGDAFSGLAQLLGGFANNMGVAAKQLESDKNVLSTFLEKVREAIIAFVKDTGNEFVKAGSVLRGLSSYINSVTKITEDFSGQTTLLTKSLTSVKSTLPEAFGDQKGLNSISRYINSIKNLKDAVRDIGSLSVEDINNFKNNLHSILGIANKVGISIKSMGEHATTASNKFSSFGNIMRYVFMGGGIYYFVRVVRQFIGATLKEFNDLNTALVSFKAITGTTNNVITELRANINRVAKDFGFAQSEIANASVTLAKAGLAAEDIAGSVYAISALARAALEDVSVSTKIATTVMLAFNKASSEMSSIANTLTAAILNSKLELKDLETQLNYTAATAGAAGIEFEDLATALAQMANTGIKASQVGTSLRGIIGLLLAPTGKFASMLYSLGVQTKDFIDVDTGKLKPLVEIMRTLSDAGLNVTRIYASMDKRMAQGMTALIENVDQLEQMETKLKNAATAFNIADTQMGSFSASVRRFASVIQANLSDAVLGVLEKFGRFMTSLAEFEGKTKLVSKSLKALIAAISALATVHFLNWITSVKIATSLTNNFAFATRLWSVATITSTGILKLFNKALWINMAYTIKTIALRKIESITTDLLTNKMIRLHISQMSYLRNIPKIIIKNLLCSKTFLVLGASIGKVVASIGLIALLYIATSKLVSWFMKANSATLEYIDTMGNFREVTTATNKLLEDQAAILADATKKWIDYRQSQVQYKDDTKDLISAGTYATIAKQIRTGKEDDASKRASNIELLVGRLAELKTILGDEVIDSFFSGKLASNYQDTMDWDASSLIKYGNYYIELVDIYKQFGKMDADVKELISISFKTLMSDGKRLGLLYDDLIKRHKSFIITQLVGDNEINKGVLDQIKLLSSLLNAREKMGTMEEELSRQNLKNLLSVENINKQIANQDSKKSGLDEQKLTIERKLKEALDARLIDTLTYTTILKMVNNEYKENIGTIEKVISSLNELRIEVGKGKNAIIDTNAWFGNMLAANDEFIQNMSDSVQESTGAFMIVNAEIERIGQMSVTAFINAQTAMEVYAERAKRFGVSQEKISSDIGAAYRTNIVNIFKEMEKSLAENGQLTESMKKQYEELYKVLSMSPAGFLQGIRESLFSIGELAVNAEKLNYSLDGVISNISLMSASFSPAVLIQERMANISDQLLSIYAGEKVLLNEHVVALEENRKLLSEQLKILSDMNIERGKSLELLNNEKNRLDQLKASQESVGGFYTFVISQAEKQLEDGKRQEGMFGKMKEDMDRASMSSSELTKSIRSTMKETASPKAVENLQKLSDALRDLDPTGFERMTKSINESLYDMVEILAAKEQSEARTREFIDRMKSMEEAERKALEEDIKASEQKLSMQQEYVKLQDIYTAYAMEGKTQSEIALMTDEQKVKYFTDMISKGEQFAELSKSIENKAKLMGSDYAEMAQKIGEMRTGFISLVESGAKVMNEELTKSKQNLVDLERNISNIIKMLEPMIIKVNLLLDRLLSDYSINIKGKGVEGLDVQKPVDMSAQVEAEKARQSELNAELKKQKALQTDILTILQGMGIINEGNYQQLGMTQQMWQDISAKAKQMSEEDMTKLANDTFPKILSNFSTIKNHVEDTGLSTEALVQDYRTWLAVGKMIFKDIKGTTAEIKNSETAVETMTKEKEKQSKAEEKLNKATEKSIATTADVASSHKGIADATKMSNENIVALQSSTAGAQETAGGLLAVWQEISSTISAAAAAAAGVGTGGGEGGDGGSGGGGESAAFGKLFKFAGGGIVRGAGKLYNDFSDRIPAWIANGEFVINSFSTRLFEPLLNMINYKPMATAKMLSGYIGKVQNIMTPSMPKTPHFATGGYADSGMYRTDKNLRPVVLVINDEPYEMYSDEAVLNKVIRANYRRIRTTK